MHTILFICADLEKHERRELLALHATAAQGDPKTIKKLLKDDGG